MPWYKVRGGQRRGSASVPLSAKVLGEWHTHPHGGSRSLSKEDVRGAYNNHHISCYVAFYSTPSGEIYAWSPRHLSVPVAMASRMPLANYREISRQVALVMSVSNSAGR